MDFVTAEEKFNELQARIRRGEPMSEDQYQEELARLMVQDDSGVFWSLEPGTGRWLYFNGTEWVPGTPPKPSAPPSMPPMAFPSQETPSPTEPAAYAPSEYQPPSYQEPASVQEPAAQAPSSYYVPSDVTRPLDYSGAYNPPPSYNADESERSYVSLPGSAPAADAEGMPTYVRMPEPETTNVPTGGIPPRPVREASPLAVPGGERAWLPFAFGALVLLLCAVVLFFGVRGLPQFSGANVSTSPTEEPTEDLNPVLPTATVELEPTEEAQPTEEPTEQIEPTAEPQPVRATATDVLNIRQGPARTTASLGKLQKGQEVVVVGRNGDGTWLQIQIPANIGSGLGWVSAEFVTVNGDINTLPVTSGENGGNAQPTETPTG